jgi:hypothetical protein
MRSAHAVLILAAIVLSGCALSSKASDFSGLKSVDGANPVHINLTKYALHLGVIWPMLGDARLDQAVADFTKEAKKLGATKVRIVQSDETRLWWILPPISLIVTPAWTNVAGDAVP